MAVPSLAPAPAQPAAPLPENVRRALDDFQRRVLELFPASVRQITLFGSYARGDWREDSDVDVLVVVEWEDEALPGGEYLAWFGDARWDRIVDIAADVLLEHGVYISPFVMGGARWAARKDSVIADIEQEGQTRWKNPQN